MFQKTIAFGLAMVFATTVGVTLLHPTPVAANTISAAMVEEQKLVVYRSLVETITEQVKLLQMMYIRQLQAQITALEAQLDNQ